MTPLRQRMTDAMIQRGLSLRTQESYVGAIYGMAKHYRRDPAEYSAHEVEAYLLHMVKERHLSYSTMNQAACAARFLYEQVLGQQRELFRIPMAKVPAKQPEILSRDEIARLIAAAIHPTHRTLLQTIYATGLRVAEACALRVASPTCWTPRCTTSRANGAPWSIAGAAASARAAWRWCCRRSAFAPVSCKAATRPSAHVCVPTWSAVRACSATV